MQKLQKKIANYVKKTDKLFLPHIWESWGVAPEDFTEALKGLWESFPNPRMVDNMLHINVKDEPKYYEVCNGRKDRGNAIAKDALFGYAYHNNRADQHVSIYTHDERWVKNYKNQGSVSCTNTIVGSERFFLELDRPSLQHAIEDAKKIYERIPYKSYVRLWYSGNKSIHIEIDSTLFGRPMGNQHRVAGYRKLMYNLAHKLAGDVRNDIDVVDPWSMSAHELKSLHRKHFGKSADHMELHKLRQKFETIDPNLFNTNSLIRQPFSVHEKRGMMKVPIPIEHLDWAGKKKFPKKKFDFGNNFPYLIHWVNECFEEKDKQVTYEVDVDEEEIIQLFDKIFKYFDPRDANQQGWVDGLYSPFYTDTNPSVGVNIKTGYYNDFGQPSHSFTFEQLKKKLNDETR